MLPLGDGKGRLPPISNIQIQDTLQYKQKCIQLHRYLQRIPIQKTKNIYTTTLPENAANSHGYSVEAALYSKYFPDS